MVIARSSSLANNNATVLARLLHEGALQPDPPHPGSATKAQWPIVVLTELPGRNALPEGSHISTGWSEIVGENNAATSRPSRLDGNTLVITTTSAERSETLAFNAELILAKVQARLPDAGIERLRFSQVAIQPDSCVINPPRPRDVLSSLGLSGDEALLLICCKDNEHIETYCEPHDGQPQLILWDYTTGDAPTQFGTFAINDVEHALEEPLFNGPRLAL